MKNPLDADVWKQADWMARAGVLLESFRRRLGRELIERSGDATEDARRLFEAPYVVVAHGTEADPILNYANRTALDLWETDVATITKMPSRLTAEAPERAERERLLARTSRDGYVDDYRGIRITSTGRRFEIDRAIVWNLDDNAGNRLGQAASFGNWRFL